MSIHIAGQDVQCIHYEWSPAQHGHPWVLEAGELALECWSWMNEDLQGTQEVSVQLRPAVSHDETEKGSKCVMAPVPHLAQSARDAHG